MNPEQLMELFKNMGGGILVIIAVLLGVYIIVALIRIRKGKGSSGPFSAQGPTNDQTIESSEEGGGGE